MSALLNARYSPSINKRASSDSNGEISLGAGMVKSFDRYKLGKKTQPTDSRALNEGYGRGDKRIKGPRVGAAKTPAGDCCGAAAPDRVTPPVVMQLLSHALLGFYY